jgi:hypothetical protein
MYVYINMHSWLMYIIMINTLPFPQAFHPAQRILPSPDAVAKQDGGEPDCISIRDLGSLEEIQAIDIRQWPPRHQGCGRAGWGDHHNCCTGWVYAFAQPKARGIVRHAFSYLLACAGRRRDKKKDSTPQPGKHPLGHVLLRFSSVSGWLCI